MTSSSSEPEAPTGASIDVQRDRDCIDFADAFTPDIWIDGRADGLNTFLPFRPLSTITA
jgi:hypothetical protein